MKADIYNTSGTKSKTKIDLPREIFGAKINEPLMAQSVKVYLSNQRKAGSKTKTRGEVRASGRKIWAQKGTGRARHGDIKAPIFVKGGRAHGPTGEENYKMKMPKKMKRKALFSALSHKYKKDEVLFVKGLGKIEGKTKEMAEILEKLTLNQSKHGSGQKLKSQKSKTKEKTAIIMDKKQENIIRAGRNISYLKLLRAKDLNCYTVLNAGKIIFTKDGVGALENTFLKNRK